ncbi:biotin biosynthesis protein BioC [Rickettsiales bacterium Ac37b]|nr:biotin biosynthesis protein BioC [Rickettsiales bacterium Ac37b]
MLDHKTNKIKSMWNYIYKFYLDYMGSIQVIIEKLKNLPETNYKLGLFHLRKGNIYDAKLRFKIVLLLNKNHLMACYKLGYCYLVMGHTKKAAQYFVNCLKIKADFVEAQYMLATIDKKRSPISFIPISIVEEFFDDLAENYHKDFVEKKGYKGHILLFESIQTLGEIKHFEKLEVLDMGCGTGLCGVYFKERSSIDFLTGIDISTQMLVQTKYAKAAGKPAYDNLLKTDFNNYILKHDKKFHIIMSACSLHYANDLEEIITHCKKMLYPGGVLAFSVEKSIGDDIVLNERMENFSYSKRYLENVANKAGFNKVIINEVAVDEKNTLVWQFVGKVF